MGIPAFEYSLHDHSSDMATIITSLVNKLTSEPSIREMVILNSVFLRNRREYCFTNGDALVVPARSIKDVNFKALVESCYNKGHLSVLFAFNEVIGIDSLYIGGRERICLSSDNSPISIKQKEAFIDALYLLKKKGIKIVYCFSHDAEYTYEIHLSKCLFE